MGRKGVDRKVHSFSILLSKAPDLSCAFQP
jgi:hypothetical protein